MAFTTNWMFKYSGSQPLKYAIADVSDALSASMGYTLNAAATTTMEEQYAWAMLINRDGQVIWDKNLPGGYSPALHPYRCSLLQPLVS